MRGSVRAALIATMLIGGIRQAQAADSVRHRPEVHATIRAKYEYQPQTGKGRFEIRNARVSIGGRMLPIVDYKAEIDLSDEGAIKMLDAYVRLRPKKGLRFTVGQMRVPFTIDAHRSPHRQYFANRSFIAKQVGSVRDVGAAVNCTFFRRCPLTLEAGIFNGSGLTGQKDFWTGDYNYSFKVQTTVARRLCLVAGYQRADAGDTKVAMYDAGAYYESGRWHVEGEYLRKRYAGGDFPAVNAADAFAAYRLPVGRLFSAVSFLGRYDYMSDHSKGRRDETGALTVDDPERHRLTGGVTLSLGSKRLQADIRLNYERYFYRSDALPGTRPSSNSCAASDTAAPLPAACDGPARRARPALCGQVDATAAVPGALRRMGRHRQGRRSLHGIGLRKRRPMP